MRYFCGTSDTSDTNDISDTSNTANSSDASKISASVTQLSNFLRINLSYICFLALQRGATTISDGI